MLSLLWCLPAFGHGGEDHSVAPPPAAAASASRVTTWSPEFEAVLRLDDVAPGRPGHATLLVSRFRTSQPVAVGSATIALSGPSQLEVTATSGALAGQWPVEVDLPSAGPWAGQVTVIADDRADVMGLPEFHLAPEVATSAPGVAWTWTAPLALGACGLVAGLLLGFATGRLGARAVAGAALGVAVGSIGLAPRSVRAHGGEDHAAAAAPAAVSGDLALHLESQFLLGLRTEFAAEEPFAESVRALGTTVARPGGSAEIHAPVTGLLSFPVGRTVLPGEWVQAGDVLATITETMSGAERSSYVEARAAAMVEVAEARKRLAAAEADLTRSAELGGVLSERDRQDRVRALDAAREAVRQAEQAAGSLDASRPTTVLRSPLTGRISALIGRPGDVVSPSDVLFRVTDSGGLWVEASVPETWAGRFDVGHRAVLVSDAHRDEAIAATVLDPGLEADPASGSLRVVLAVDQPIPWLVPGMSVTASIETGTRRDALVIPDAAVVDGTGETLVFVKTAPESFEARAVRVGALSGDRREVLEGVRPGERVVVQGTYALRSLAGR